MAGLVLIPLSVFMLSGSRTLPTLVKHVGVRAVLAAGCLVVALSSAFFAVFHGARWEAFVMMGILGAGLGTTFAAIPGLIVRAVPAHETAARATRHDQPTLAGYTMVLWVSAAICVVAAALAWFLPARARKLAPAERLPAEELRLLEQTDGEDLIADNHRS